MSFIESQKSILLHFIDINSINHSINNKHFKDVQNEKIHINPKMPKIPRDT